MTAKGGLLHPEITRAIIAAFFEVYNELGYGLLESVYAAARMQELTGKGHDIQREHWVDVYYKGKPIARQRIDLIVDQRVVVEIKATEVLPRFAERQLLSYLTVTHLEVGLVLHFGPEAKFAARYRQSQFSHPRESLFIRVNPRSPLAERQSWPEPGPPPWQGSLSHLRRVPVTSM
jgi:GxxExxY protein